MRTVFSQGTLREFSDIETICIPEGSCEETQQQGTLEIDILSELPTSSDKGFIWVEAKVTSSGWLKSVKIIHNQKVIDIPARSKKQVNIREPIELVEGRNSIRIEARSSSKTMESSTYFVDFRKSTPPKPKKSEPEEPEVPQSESPPRKDYALIFAAGNYGGGEWNPLNNAIPDAIALKKELENRFGFEVRLVKDPTRQDMDKELRSMVRKDFGPDDQLLVFFSGHGYKDPDYATGYLVPLKATDSYAYYSHSNFLEQVNRIECNHILVIADACFSGLFADHDLGKRSNNTPKRGGRLYQNKSDREFIQGELQYPTRKFLASGADVVQDGIRGSHTPFMRELLTAFRGDLGGDAFLELGELIIQTNKIRISRPVHGSFGTDSPSSNFLFIQNK